MWEEKYCIKIFSQSLTSEVRALNFGIAKEVSKLECLLMTLERGVNMKVNLNFGTYKERSIRLTMLCGRRKSIRVRGRRESVCAIVVEDKYSRKVAVRLGLFALYYAAYFREELD